MFFAVGLAGGAQILTRRVAGVDSPETSALFSSVVGAFGMLLVLPFVPGLMTWALAVLWAFLVVRGRKQDARDRRLVEDALARDRSRRPGGRQRTG